SLPDLREATERAYQLAIDAKKATLSEATRTSAQGRLRGRVPSPTMSADRPRTARTEEGRAMYVKVGDIDIFYTIAGVGPTCLVPSLAGTPIYERTFTPALQDVMQLVFVELRGN